MDANFWHFEIRVGRVQLGDWPNGVSFDKQPVLYGFDSHSWGLMADDAAPGPGLALVFYHADEASPNVVPALKFRGFDIASWFPKAEVTIDELGTSVYAFSQGASIQGQSYEGYGYAVTYHAFVESSA